MHNAGATTHHRPVHNASATSLMSLEGMISVTQHPHGSLLRVRATQNVSRGMGSKSNASATSFA